MANGDGVEEPLNAGLHVAAHASVEQAGEAVEAGGLLGAAFSAGDAAERPA